jgi:chromosome segregation ATPase
MEQVKDFLKAIKVPQDVIADLLDGKEVDVQRVAKTYEEDRTDVIRAKLEPEILETTKSEENKKALLAVEGAMKQKLKKTFGLTLSNIREMSMEEFLEKAQAEIDETKKGGDESLKKQLSDLMEKYNSAEENLVTLKSQVKEKDEKIESVRKEVEEKFARTRVLNSALDKVKWAFEDPTRVEREKRIVMKEIEELFQVGSDGSMKNLDGTVVVKPNDSGIYKNVDEWITDYANQYKLVKQSDPRGGETPPPAAGPKKELSSYLDQFAKELG